MKKRGFTLLEVIIATTCFFLLLVAIINIYSKMINLKYNIQAKTNVTQDTYFAIEKINLLLKDYTIDYEEYFNRKNVGCDSSAESVSGSSRDNGHCDLFTAYGNNNNIDGVGTAAPERKIYFCSSTDDESVPYRVILNPDVQNGSGCLSTGQQSFGQYYRQFRDVKKDVNAVSGARHDSDDENVGKGPDAVSTGTQELYFISQDGKSRILIRRALIESGDRNHDGTISGDSEKRYTLQILKLRGFDAGNSHTFDITTSSGVYDSKIDTRACDYDQGFVCNGSGIGNVYANYKLPLDQDDGRVNLFQKNITIADRNIIVSPTKNPEYARTENAVQINPYFTISITSKLYGQIRQKRLGNSIDNFQIHLQTIFNTKNFYIK